MTAEPAPAQLLYADLELDEHSHRVRRAGREIDLSPTEYALLHHLLVNAGRIQSKRQLLHHVWRDEVRGGGVGGAGVVESYVSYLRRKVETGDPKLIHTVRGIGYVLRAPGERVRRAG